MSSQTNKNDASYIVAGTIKITSDREPSKLSELTISLYKEVKGHGDVLLGFTVPDSKGAFSISFESEAEKLDDHLYFLVQLGGLNVYSPNLPHKIPAKLGDDNQIEVTDKTIQKYVNTEQVPGWKGGFADSNPAFKYPDPDLTSLPLYENMANIDLLERQQKIIWPEFSWLAKPGEKDSRLFQMFAPDISRIGYNDEGRCYSIICPQQGASLGPLGNLNVEVTVTGNRGWVDEDPTKQQLDNGPVDSLATDMRVTGKIWYSAPEQGQPLIELLKESLRQHLQHLGINVDGYEHYNFPTSKAHAIHVKTHLYESVDQPTFPLQRGLSDLFPAPDFTLHNNLAWSNGHIDVQIGKVWKTGSKVIDLVNQIIIDLFNAYKQNMLKDGNVLSWNVWFAYPEIVDQYEWWTHAERWRHSLNVNHGSPFANGLLGNGTVIRNAKGDFVPSPPINKWTIIRIIIVNIWKVLHPDLARDLEKTEKLVYEVVKANLRGNVEELRFKELEVDLEKKLEQFIVQWRENF